MVAVTKNIMKMAVKLVNNINDYENFGKIMDVLGHQLKIQMTILKEELSWYPYSSDWLILFSPPQSEDIGDNYEFCIVGEINDPTYGKMITRCQYPTEIAPRQMNSSQ